MFSIKEELNKQSRLTSFLGGTINNDNPEKYKFLAMIFTLEGLLRLMEKTNKDSSRLMLYYNYYSQLQQWFTNLLKEGTLFSPVIQIALHDYFLPNLPTIEFENEQEIADLGQSINKLFPNTPEEVIDSSSPPAADILNFKEARSTFFHSPQSEYYPQQPTYMHSSRFKTNSSGVVANEPTLSKKRKRPYEARDPLAHVNPQEVKFLKPDAVTTKVDRIPVYQTQQLRPLEQQKTVNEPLQVISDDLRQMREEEAASRSCLLS